MQRDWIQQHNTDPWWSTDGRILTKTAAAESFPEESVTFGGGPLDTPRQKKSAGPIHG